MVPKAPKTSPGAPGSMLTKLPEMWATERFGEVRCRAPGSQSLRCDTVR